MNKDLIKARFSRSLPTYDKNARIQKKMAEHLITLIDFDSYSSVLEIGCGTGLLTEILNDRVQFETYNAIDIVNDCKPYINKINSEINFINEDIETFINSNIIKYDLIISNASLQWVNNFEEVVKKLQKSLNKNGTLVFSTFGRENFREIELTTGISLNYYSLKELEEIFPQSKIETEIHIIDFNTPKDVLKHLQYTGVNSIEPKIWTKKDLSKFENAYNNICPNRPTLTYNPVYIKLLADLK